MRLLICGLALVGLLGAGTPAVAGPAAPDKPGAGAAGLSVGRPAAAGDAVPNMPCEGCDPPCNPTREYCEDFWFSCLPSFSRTVTHGVTEDGDGWTRIRWTGWWNCTGNINPYLNPINISGRTVLYDRTAGQGDRIIKVGAWVSGVNNVASEGPDNDAVLFDSSYPAGRDVEIVWETTISVGNLYPENWHPQCSPLSGGLRWLRCDIGFDSATLAVGTGAFGSGVQAPPCAGTDPPQTSPDAIDFVLSCGTAAAALSTAVPTIHCEVRTDYPHKSSTVAGNVNVHGWVDCTAPPGVKMTSLTIQVTLIRDGSTVAASPPLTKTGENYAEDNAAEPCHTGTYTGVATVLAIPPPNYRPSTRPGYFSSPPIPITC
jgi:hypothetical protein